MPIDTHVAGDENSVRTAADAIRKLASAATGGADALVKARNDSETQWRSGDEFRAKVAGMSRSTDQIADRAREIAGGLDDFAGQLAAVKARMADIRHTASASLLTVNGEVIEEPVLSPDPADSVVDRVKVVAYGECVEAWAAARVNEANAHRSLQSLLTLKGDAIADLKQDGVFVVASAGAGLVSGLVENTRAWGKVAGQRADQAALWRKLMEADKNDPYFEALDARKVGVYAASAEEYSTLEASSQKVLDRIGIKQFNLGGLASEDSRLGNLMVANLDEIPYGKVLGKAGSKIPLVGTGIAVFQTAYDVDHADGAVAKVEAATGDIGGTVLGSMATSGATGWLIAAGMAGGPATMVGVGAGVAVAVGVGYAVNHWSDISNFVGDLF